MRVRQIIPTQVLNITSKPEPNQIDVFLKFPYEKRYYFNTRDYFCTLFRAAEEYSELKIDQIHFILRHLGDFFRPFVDKLRSKVDIYTFDLKLLIDHFLMEFRRKRHHLQYNNPRHYYRLHSITKICSCMLCRDLFSNCQVLWPEALFNLRTNEKLIHSVKEFEDKYCKPKANKNGQNNTNNSKQALLIKKKKKTVTFHS